MPNELITLIAEIVGFLVILFVLYRYVLPLLKPMVRDRQDAIQQQVDDSEEATRKLQEAEKRLDKAVAEARDQTARIRDDARADAERIREELREAADREVERIKQRGEEQLVAQRDQVVRRLRAEIGGQSMALAERIVVESLSDEASRRESVTGVLNDLEEMAGRGEDDDRADDRQATPTGGKAS